MILHSEHAISKTVLRKCMVLTSTIIIHFGLYDIRGMSFRSLPKSIRTLGRLPSERFAGGRGSTLAHVSKAPSGPWVVLKCWGLLKA